MRPVFAIAATMAALLFAVAACAGQGSGVVYYSDFTAGYDPGSMGAAMSRAPLLVETYGAPAAGLAQESISRATALALRRYGPPWLPRNYTDAAADAGTTPYHLRFAYSVPNGFDRQRLCKAAMSGSALEATQSQSSALSTRTVAALCRGEATLVIAEGSPGLNPDITGENFARFIGMMGRELMPRRNPVLDDDCIFRFCD